MESWVLDSLPLGFGFHPTDVELLSFYLKRKVHGLNFDHLIPVLDIYKHEPWDLPSKSPLPTRDSTWHFFTPRDHPKYPNAKTHRSNRATPAGYWKSTGKDRNIRHANQIIGTKKTLVFHQGRPPTGARTEWIMHEFFLHQNQCTDAPHLKELFALCRVTKRDGFSSHADTSAPPQAVPNEQDRLPIVSDNSSSLSETIHTSNNPQQDDMENWLHELFDPDFSATPPVGQLCRTEPVVLTSAVPKPEPKYYSPGEGSEDENPFLLQEDLQSILGTSFDENTQNLKFLDDGTTGPNFLNNCNFVNYNNEDDETGIVIRQRSRTTSYDNPNDNEVSNINNYKLKSKLQVHLCKMEEKSLETANFVPKDGLVSESGDSEKIKGKGEDVLKSSAPKRGKRTGSLGAGTLILSALLVGGIAALFCFMSDNSAVAS
ncbi:NAC domain-containing protein 74 [Rhynchospora pubera]|uniref:NAC domain-containing protein 74 n=1 Tax=Rhynchospora pubera TaxID=906938 RepID=A0AAV8FS30_9POAL|nr:NAC domain-containing protein 74 [Rhynchospora pubera]